MRPAVALDRRTFAKTVAASAAALAVPDQLLHGAEMQGDLGIMHNAAAIHREAVIKATPARIYAALTEAKQFDGVYKLSNAAKTMPATTGPSAISKEPGGTFALFGGYITGRQIELVPNSHIVQVWRSAGWPAGDYSLVVWNITAAGDSTKLSLDHTGFPAAEAEHLAQGWRDNYFVPLIKYVSS
jgi:activator of HSP90 ATPase